MAVGLLTMRVRIVHEYVVSDWFPTPWPQDGQAIYPDPTVRALPAFHPTRYWVMPVDYTKEQCLALGYTERHCKRDRWAPYPGPVRMELWGSAGGMLAQEAAREVPREGRFRWDTELLLVIGDSEDGDRSDGSSDVEGEGPAGAGHSGSGLGGEEVTHMMPGDTGAYDGDENAGEFGAPEGFTRNRGESIRYDERPGEDGSVGHPESTVARPNATTVRYPADTPLGSDTPPYPGAELGHGIQPVEGDEFGMTLDEVMKVDDFRFQLKFTRQPDVKVAEGEWAWGCNSDKHVSRFVRLYRFEVWRRGLVEVRLASGGVSSSVHLREGYARSGAAVGSDSGAGVLEFEAELEKGIYTIRVESSTPDVVGGLVPSVSAVAAVAPLMEDDEAIVTVPVMLEDYFARFYRFAITEPSLVTAVLDSGPVVSYLYLRRGAGNTTGTAMEEDGGTGRSRVSAVLPIGSYTLEVVSDIAEQVGEFELTVSGLSKGTAVGADENVPECHEDLTYSGVMWRAFSYEGWYSALETLSVTPWMDWEYKMDDVRYPFQELVNRPPDMRIDPPDDEIAMITVDLEDWQETYGGKSGPGGLPTGSENAGGVYVFQLAYMDVSSGEPLEWTDGRFHFVGYRELPGHQPVDWNVDAVALTGHEAATAVPTPRGGLSRLSAPRITGLQGYGTAGKVWVSVSWSGTGTLQYRNWSYYGGRTDGFRDVRRGADDDQNTVDYEWHDATLIGGVIKLFVPFVDNIWAFELRAFGERDVVIDGERVTVDISSPGSNVEQIAVWGPGHPGHIPVADPDG